MALVEKNGKIVDFIETTGELKRVEDYIASAPKSAVKEIKEEPKEIEIEDEEEEEIVEQKENKHK